LTIRRIRGGEIAVGAPLPWDVHGEGGGLLLRQGHVIASEHQRVMLLERGLIPDEEALAAVAAAAYRDPPSVLRLLNQAASHLQPVLQDIAGGAAVQATARLREVAGLVTQAAELDLEVALGCTLLNQKSGLYTIRHAIDTALVAHTLGRALQQSAEALDSQVLAALSMNVGLLHHHERLQNTAMALGEADLGLIRGHPGAGVALLRRAGVDDPAWLSCVLEHHENDDASGYPMGKNVTQIGEAARIVALADRYLARVSARAYRKTMLPNAALREMLLEAQRSSQAQLVTLLIRELGIYPVGTFVRLHNGEVGVVSRRGLNATQPYVHALLGPRGAPLDVPLRRAAKGDNHGIREVLDEEQAGVAVRLESIWGAVARI